MGKQIRYYKCALRRSNFNASSVCDFTRPFLSCITWGSLRPLCLDFRLHRLLSSYDFVPRIFNRETLQIMYAKILTNSEGEEDEYFEDARVIPSEKLYELFDAELKKDTETSNILRRLLSGRFDDETINYLSYNDISLWMLAFGYYLDLDGVDDIDGDYTREVLSIVQELMDKATHWHKDRRHYPVFSSSQESSSLINNLWFNGTINYSAQ